MSEQKPRHLIGDIVVYDKMEWEVIGGYAVIQQVSRYPLVCGTGRVWYYWLKSTKRQYGSAYCLCPSMPVQERDLKAPETPKLLTVVDPLGFGGRSLQDSMEFSLKEKFNPDDQGTKEG